MSVDTLSDHTPITDLAADVRLYCFLVQNANIQTCQPDISACQPDMSAALPDLSPFFGNIFCVDQKFRQKVCQHITNASEQRQNETLPLNLTTN